MALTGRWEFFWDRFDFVFDAEGKPAGGKGPKGYWKCEKGEVRHVPADSGKLSESGWVGFVYLGGKKFRIGERFDCMEVAQGAVERVWERETNKRKVG